MPDNEISIVPYNEDGSTPSLLQQVNIIAPKKYFYGWDEKTGERRYTTNIDLARKYGYYLDEQPKDSLAERRTKWRQENMSHGRVRPGLRGYAKDVANFTTAAVGTPMILLGAPLVGQTLIRGGLNLTKNIGKGIVQAVKNPINFGVDYLVGDIVGDEGAKLDKKLGVTKAFNSLNLPDLPDNFIGEITGNMVGSVGQEYINSKLGKLFRYSTLQKNYTGVPHTQLKNKTTGELVTDASGNPVYMDENFLNAHKKGDLTIWASNDLDYAKNGAWSGLENNSVFDIYTEPNLKILLTPFPKQGEHFSWGSLPFELKGNSVKMAPKKELVRHSSYIARNKKAALETPPPYNKKSIQVSKKVDHEGFINSPFHYKGALSTDDVVDFSKSLGKDATQFYNVYDGYSIINGQMHDYPINELVLNPGATSYALPHGTPKINVLKQMSTNFDPKTATIIQGLSNIPAIKDKIDYAKGYFGSVFFPQSYFMDLSDKNVSRITSDTKNVNSILFNDFYEHTPGSFGPARIFKNADTSYTIGDNNIPISNISTYYGIEDGKLKAGDLSIFNDDTTVIPNRFKTRGKIKKFLNTNEYINESGDTISMDRYSMPKIAFADPNGNAAFVSNLKDNLDKVNEYLSKHPSYPLYLDNGRYSAFQLKDINYNVYKGIAGEDNFYAVGTLDD